MNEYLIKYHIIEEREDTREADNLENAITHLKSAQKSGTKIEIIHAEKICE